MILSPFTNDAIWNIIGHIQTDWTHAKFNPIAIEHTVATALMPFYENTQHLGSSGGFVDVKADKIALDIKSRKTLTIKNSISRYRVNYGNYSYIEHDSPQTCIRIPKEVSTMVRRPCYDLENFNGDPEKHIKAQLKEYQKFAKQSSKLHKCTDIWSMIIQYGILNSVRVIYIAFEPFSVPKLTHYHATKNSYVGKDARGKNMFSIVRMNTGSVNTFKTFITPRGISSIWIKEEGPPVLYTKNDIEAKSTINIIT